MVEMRQEQGAGPQVTGFSGTGFKVRDTVFPDGVILTQEEARTWTPPAIDALAMADLGDALESEPRPEFLLLGTGAKLVQPPAAFRRAMEERGIGIEAMDSRAAARTLALLRAEERWVVAALYPLG